MANERVVKCFRGLTIKDADKGEVEAVVATLDVIDKDGDIIRKGALGKTTRVAMSSWGHDAVLGARPAGKGTLSADGNQLVFKGRVFLNTADGRDTFEVLKEMADDQEWSFAFHVLGSEVPSEDEKKQGAWRAIMKMDAFEVSPVLIGAGVDTQTTRIKSAAQADGDGSARATPTVPADVKALADTVIAEVAARLEADRKAAEAAAIEAARVEAETKAAIEAAAAQEALVVASHAAAAEFAKFLRTMRRVA